MKVYDSRPDVQLTPTVMARIWELVERVRSDPTGVATVAPLDPLLAAVAASAATGGKPLASAYPSPRVLRAAIDPVLRGALQVVSQDPEEWSVTLPAVSLLFQLYTDRSGAVTIAEGWTPPTVPFIADYQQLALPMDRICAHLYDNFRSLEFVSAAPAAQRFVTHYLTMTYRHQIFSRAKPEDFYRLTRRSAAAPVLSLIHLFLDPVYYSATGPPPIGVMDTAEASVRPFDGLRAQTAHALFLEEQGSTLRMAPEQLFAARPACKVWRELRQGCARCFTYLPKPRRQCSGCKRVRYCSVECQSADWTDGGHDVACVVWRRVNIDLDGEDSRLLAQAMSVDIYRNVL